MFSTRQRLIGTASLLGAALASCSPGEQGVTQAHAGNPVIVLSEGPCPETCPVYDMTLHADGSYLLHGKRFVRETGTSEGNLDPSAWKAGEAALRRANFWLAAPDQTHSGQLTCQPGAPIASITWRTREGRQKTVRYKVGCGDEAMRTLVVDLRKALAFDRLVRSDERFSLGGGR